MVDKYLVISSARKALISLLIIFLTSSCSADVDKDLNITSTTAVTMTPEPDNIIAQEQEEPTPTTQVISPTATDPALTTLIHEVVVWHGLDDQGNLALKEIVENYQDTNPQIQVHLDYIPYDDLQGRFLQDVSSGAGPDILLGAGEWSTKLYKQDVVKELPESSLIELRENLNPPAYNAVYYGDIPIALPFSIHGIVVFRNTAIMPDAPKTFEELVASSQKVSKGRIIGAYLERGDLFAFAQITACQGMLLFPNGYPAFNNPAGLCWINLLSRFEIAGPVSFNSDDDLRRFKAGTVGLIFAGTWNLSEVHEALGENLVIDPWPTYGDSHLSGYVWTENVYLNANLNGDELNQALEFSRYLLSPEGQTVLAKTGRIPATLYRDVQDKFIFQAIAALKDGTIYPVIPEMELYKEPMHKVLLAIFESNDEPSFVLKTAEDEILSLISNFSDKEDDF